MADAVDWTNSCAKAETLRNAYHRLLSGSAESVVRYTGNGIEREVRYQAIDRTALYDEWQRAERECESAMGYAPKTRVRTIRLNPSKGF